MKNCQISHIFIIVSLLLTVLFLPKQAHAYSTSLEVSPTLIRIEAKPPADIWTPFTIENSANQPISLKIGYKTFDPQASRNGTVTFLNEAQNIPGIDKNIFEKMQIVDDQNISHDSIDIGPKQKLRFRLRITLPANEPVSDYYFSLIFLQPDTGVDQSDINTNTEDQKSASSIQTGIGLNVLLAVGDKEAPDASVDSFNAPWFTNQGPVPFTLSVHNSGTHFITPHGNIVIKNLFGQIVGKVPVPSSIILADTSRDLSGTQGDLTANSDPPKLIWPETILFGAYTATLTLVLSNQGPVFTRTIHFIAFPVILFLEIVIVLLIIFFIILRVKRKLS